MAITPFDWNASNGSASAAQTRRAYNALVTQSNTTEFSRYVWNDIVNKINEVVRALNRSWNTQYASLAATRASYLYQSWTAAMFNSARLNTNYPSWTWEYDRTKQGYTGRTEMRGVSNYGDSGADIVYGDYILELVKRLNTVIGIINGTQDINELSESVPLLLELLAELTTPASAPFSRTRQQEILLPHALLQSENLPTMTLHFVIPAAQIRAVLEQEELSSMMEGYMFATLQAGGRLNRLHSVLLSQVIPSRASYSALLRLLEGSHLQATAEQIAHVESNIGQLPSASLRSFWHTEIAHEATAVSKEASGIDWTHFRVMLEPDAELSSELNSVMHALGEQRGIFVAGLGRGTPTRMATDIDLGVGMRPEANFEQSDPLGITLHHEVDTVGTAANLGLVQFMESMNAGLDMHPLTTSATLAYEHISTMLNAYLRLSQTAEARLTNNIIAGMEHTVDIRVEITAEAVSDYAPNIAKAIEIVLTIGSELHSGFAPKLLHHERITLTPAALQHTAFAPNLDSIRHAYEVALRGTLTRESRAINAIAHGRLGHAIESMMHLSAAEPAAAELAFGLPEVNGTLGAAEPTGTFTAIGHQSHVTEAALAYINGILTAEAQAQMALGHVGELGYIFYADLQGRTAVELMMEALIDAEGGGWQYPVIVGTDASIFQVWLTEQNRQHLFLDPNNGRYHAQIRTAVSGAIDKQFRVGAESESNHRLAVQAELHKRQRGNWEYPVQTDNVLLITQAIDALPHYQYNLEVR